MTNECERVGSCLCGAIQFIARQASSHVGACHCRMCRKWGGGPFVEVNCGSEIAFSGEENIAVFNSSDWAERGFCRQCGSHLFYRVKETREHMVPAGLFDNDADFVFSNQVFIDEKPAYYDFSNKTQNLTGEELFAQFAPPAE